jgi:hypothetical protein
MTVAERLAVALLRRLGYLIVTPQELARAKAVKAELDRGQG